MIDHKTSWHTTKIRCVPCKLTFRSTAELNKHLKYHKNHLQSNEKPFKCEQCTKYINNFYIFYLNPYLYNFRSYTSPKLLRRHVYNDHEDHNMIQCPLYSHCKHQVKSPNKNMLVWHLTGSNGYQTSHGKHQPGEYSEEKARQLLSDHGINIRINMTHKKRIANNN
jgi:hypothetical protein